MIDFLEKIVNSKLGKILDQLFLGFRFFFPNFTLYLIVPTVIFSFMQFFGVQWVTDLVMLKLTLFLLPIFILGTFWFIYRTTRLD